MLRLSCSTICTMFECRQNNFAIVVDWHVSIVAIDCILQTQIWHQDKYMTWQRTWRHSPDSCHKRFCTVTFRVLERLCLLQCNKGLLAKAITTVALIVCTCWERLSSTLWKVGRQHWTSAIPCDVNRWICESIEGPISSSGAWGCICSVQTYQFKSACLERCLGYFTRKLIKYQGEWWQLGSEVS